MSPEAVRHRTKKLCPFNNKVPNCTKDKANDPLGTCSIFDTNGDVTITCPIRFREDWLIADAAAAFFFPPGASWTSLIEVRLDDADGQSAGNIDVVLVSYDQRGRVTDFGSVEVQAVYISGNVRRPFEYYMQDPATRYNMVWRGAGVQVVRPDYLSSSRKRLAPQLLFKGGIMKAWNKRQVVVLHRSFYATLPDLPEVEPHEAEMAWLLYDLRLDPTANRYQLSHYRTVYTRFADALERITVSRPGPVEAFMGKLQVRLDAKMDDGDNPPDAPILSDIIVQE